jgi:hypothetical protein
MKWLLIDKMKVTVHAGLAEHKWQQDVRLSVGSSGKRVPGHCSSRSDAPSQSALTRRPHKESGANLKQPAFFHCVQREPEAQ